MAVRRYRTRVNASQKAAQRALLDDHGHLLVRRAVDRDDAVTLAILDLAVGDQTEWTPQQWDTLLSELAGCDMTIEEWLIFYG